MLPSRIGDNLGRRRQPHAEFLISAPHCYKLELHAPSEWRTLFTASDLPDMLRRVILIGLLCCAATTTSHAQIVALGASSTAGYGVGVSASFPSQLEAILRARGRPMSVRNAGISGDTTGGMLARLSSAVPEGTKIVILQIAGNDAMKGMNLANAQANRAEIRKELHRRGIRTIEADGYVLSALRSGLRQPDGIHMTAEGHRRVAEQLAAQIR
jgi:acyl-CoA thioesterase I